MTILLASALIKVSFKQKLAPLNLHQGAAMTYLHLSWERPGELSVLTHKINVLLINSLGPNQINSKDCVLLRYHQRGSTQQVSADGKSLPPQRPGRRTNVFNITENMLRYKLFTSNMFFIPKFQGRVNYDSIVFLCHKYSVIVQIITEKGQLRL